MIDISEFETIKPSKIRKNEIISSNSSISVGKNIAKVLGKRIKILANKTKDVIIFLPSELSKKKENNFTISKNQYGGNSQILCKTIVDLINNGRYDAERFENGFVIKDALVGVNEP